MSPMVAAGDSPWHSTSAAPTSGFREGCAYLWKPADARKLVGASAPDVGGQAIVDLDRVVVLAHSEKQDATET